MPCLAKEHEVKVESAGGFEDVCESLDLCITSKSHSNRDLSLFDPDCLPGPWVNSLESYEFTSLDSVEEAEFAWDQDNVSRGPSRGPCSSDSCGQSNAMDAADPGLELCSANISSNSRGNFSAFDNSGEPAGPLRNFGPLSGWANMSSDLLPHQMSSNWARNGLELGSGVEVQYKVELDLGGDAEEVGDLLAAQPTFKSFLPAPHSMPGVAPWAVPGCLLGMGSRNLSAGSSLALGSHVSMDASVSMHRQPQQQLCRSPLSNVSTDLSVDLGGAIDDELFLGMDGIDAAAPAPVYTERQRQMVIEKAKRQASRQEAGGGGSPRNTGSKRPASSAGCIARKLMSHPEGHSCTQCGAKSTPVWRAGPLGPKTLCNACGVRYSKFVRKK